MVRLVGPGQDSSAGVSAGASKATPKAVSLGGREGDLLLQSSAVHPPSILAGAGERPLMPWLFLSLLACEHGPEEHGCSLPVPGRAGDTAWEGTSLRQYMLLQRPEDLTAPKRVACSQGRPGQVKWPPKSPLDLSFL